MCKMADNSYNPALQSVRDLQAESWSQNLSLSLQTNVRRVVEYIDQVKYWQLPAWRLLAAQDNLFKHREKPWSSES